MKYKTEIVNNHGCIFDGASFKSVLSVKQWAIGRGGKNKLVLIDGESRKEFFAK